MCRYITRFKRIPAAISPSPTNANNLDLVAEELEILQELLLLKGVAVGGFAHHFQLIFDTLQRSVLFHHLLAQIAMLCLEHGQPFFKRSEVNLGRGRRRRRRRE